MKAVYLQGKKDNIIIKLETHFLRNVVRKKTPMIDSIIKVIVGEKYIKNIHKKYGEHTTVLFMRGATGDVYIQFMTMNNWLRENNIKSYVIVSDSLSIDSVSKLFPHVDYVAIRGYIADSIEKAYMLLGADYLKLKVLLPWTYSLYFNRCRVRMTEKFNFIDSYKWYVYGLKNQMEFQKPKFDSISNSELKKYGIIKGRTIIISPEANSVTLLSVKFWNNLIDIFTKKGFRVLVNVKETKKYHANTIFFEYKKGVSLLENAGYFIGIRSGLCDIMSTAKCKKVIIYPKESKVINYSEHRSEISFSGLRTMELVDDNDEYLVELETKLIRNITQKQSEIANKSEYDYEIKSLQNKILNSVLT